MTINEIFGIIVLIFIAAALISYATGFNHTLDDWSKKMDEEAKRKKEEKKKKEQKPKEQNRYYSNF